MSENLITLNNRYVLDEDDFIGKGMYGDVYGGYILDDPSRKIAIKKMTRSQKTEKVMNCEIAAAAKLRLIRNDNLIRVHDISLTPDRNTLYIIMERCYGGDVKEYLLKNAPSGLSVKHAQRVMVQIAEGMLKLYEKRIIHRDLKTDNLFISCSDPDSWIVKIADFGLSKLFGPLDVSMTGTLCGTPINTAPEIIHRKTKGRYGRSVDIWSLGCILYELLTGVGPMVGFIVTVMDIFKKKPDPSIIDYSKIHDDDAKDLIRRCLMWDENLNPTWKERISFMDFYQHPFLAKHREKFRMVDFSADEYSIEGSRSFYFLSRLSEKTNDIAKLKTSEPVLMMKVVEEEEEEDNAVSSSSSSSSSSLPSILNQCKYAFLLAYCCRFVDSNVYKFVLLCRSLRILSRLLEKRRKAGEKDEEVKTQNLLCWAECRKKEYKDIAQRIYKYDKYSTFDPSGYENNGNFKCLEYILYKIFQEVMSPLLKTFIDDDDDDDEEEEDKEEEGEEKWEIWDSEEEEEEEEEEDDEDDGLKENKMILEILVWLLEYLGSGQKEGVVEVGKSIDLWFLDTYSSMIRKLQVILNKGSE